MTGGDTERLSFTKEELGEIQPDPDLADIDAELDDEEFRGNSEMARLGFSPEEIARIRGKASPDDLMKPQRKVTVAGLESELAEIEALKKTDRHTYWNDETQGRAVEIIAELGRLKDGTKPAEQERKAEGETSADIGDGLPQALKDEWSEQLGGVEVALAAIKQRTTIIDEILEPGEADQLKQGFDDLPPDAQAEIAKSLSTDGGGWPKASPADLAEFAEAEHGKVLLQSWGDAAPIRLGAAKREADFILSRMTERSRVETHRWTQGLSPAKKRAVIEVLATRAARRSLIRASGRGR